MRTSEDITTPEVLFGYIQPSLKLRGVNCNIWTVGDFYRAHGGSTMLQLRPRIHVLVRIPRLVVWIGRLAALECSCSAEGFNQLCEYHVEMHVAEKIASICIWRYVYI